MEKSDYESVPIKSSEITPEHVYLNRRQFLKTTTIIGAGALLTACGVKTTAVPSAQPTGSATSSTSSSLQTGKKDELGDPVNSLTDITHYNNYYEFSTGKEDVAVLARDFKTTPWTVEVSGLVTKPKTFGVEDLLKMFPQEERIYRLRCVEAWSMVIPWTGFPLASLLNEVEPQSSAKYVRFTTIAASDQMPGLQDALYPWPYQEGLRLDEAMNNLTLLGTGLYGKPLPPQDGAPIRLIVPWKYGFKSAKALVKIELVAEQPQTFWSTIASDEYGFYSNVNPDVPHPRWSQATERRIGEISRRKTLMFNGYAGEVVQLYKNMDLKANY